MDHYASTQSTKILHGLHYMWAVPDSIPGLLSAKKPTMQFAVKTGSVTGIPTRFKNSFYLSGADAMPTAGARTVTLSGSIAQQTLRVTFHAVPVGNDGTAGTLAAGPFHDVICEYDVQTSNTLTTAAAALKAVVNIAIAGTGTPTNGRIKCPTNTRATLADIGTGMALKFAAAVSTTPDIVFNGASTGGTVQNTYDITVEAIAQAPGILGLSSDNYPTLPGVYFLGATLDPVLDLAATEQSIDSGQSYNPLDTYVTATAGKLTGQVLEDGNIRTQRLLQQIADEFSTDNYSGLLPNFLPGGQTAGIVLLRDSLTYPGNNDIVLLRKIRSNSVKYEYKKAHTPVPFSFGIVKPNEDDLLYIANYQPKVA